MSCACDLCERNNTVADALARLPVSERDFWAGIYEDLSTAEMDRDWANAIIDGSWPDADEVIERARDRITLTPLGESLTGGAK